jgi:hypothetical protein
MAAYTEIIVLRRSVQLALILAIATLQCVSWTSVDDAPQQGRDGRTIIAAAAHGGVGTARVRVTPPGLLSGADTRSFILDSPALSVITLHARPAPRASNSPVEGPLAQRPPPPAA